MQGFANMLKMMGIDIESLGAQFRPVIEEQVAKVAGEFQASEARIIAAINANLDAKIEAAVSYLEEEIKKTSADYVPSGFVVPENAVDVQQLTLANAGAYDGAPTLAANNPVDPAKVLTSEDHDGVSGEPLTSQPA